MSNFQQRQNVYKRQNGSVSGTRRLKTPWSNVSFPAASSIGVVIGMVALFIVLTLLGLALLIGSAVVLVINIIDITQVGPNFWNIFWIVLSSLFLLGGLRQTVSS